MTNPKLVYGGCPKFGFAISYTDFQNVAPVKKDIGFSSFPQKNLEFFQKWENFVLIIYLMAIIFDDDNFFGFSK